MIYGGGFRHRDANWVLGAELVNLEISRGSDLRGRDPALVKLCGLALRHEFDRIRLINHLAKQETIDVAAMRPQLLMTATERSEAASVLISHCRETGADPLDPSLASWREAAETTFGVAMDPAGRAAGAAAAGTRRRRFGRFMRRRIRAWLKSDES